MQDIHYMLVRTPHTADLTRAQASTIAALIHQVPTIRSLDITVTEMLGIFLEQTVLTQYMQDMNPTNTKLQDYKDLIRLSFNLEIQNGTFNTDKLEAERIHQSTFRLISDYVSGETDYLTGSDLESVIRTVLQGNQYATIPYNFLRPYLNFRANAIMDENITSMPCTLSPIYKKDIDHPDDLILSFYIRPHLSMQANQRVKFFNGTSPNKTLSYITAMNFNGYTWRSLVDEIQSCHFHYGTQKGTESLSNALNLYLHDKPLPTSVDTTLLRQQFNTAFSALVNRRELLVEEESISGLDDLYRFLQDTRLSIYLVDDLTVGMEELYFQFHNEEPFKSLELLGFTPGKKKISESYAMADDSGGDNSNTDSNKEDPTEDAEENEEMGDDLFGDDGGFGDMDGDGDNENGSQDSTDTSTSSSSSNTTTTATTTDSSSTTATQAEDVNPVIEIIDDESFDEYLDRSILSIRLKRLITNPPTSLSSIDLHFLKHWYLQWFPCVSVATTREILGDLLSIPSKKLTTD